MNIPYTEMVGRHKTGVGVYAVSVPRPPFGCACYMAVHKGVYQLFVGEGLLSSVSCTHVGVGGIEIFDGVVNEHGNLIGAHKPLYKANPQTMCLWVMNSGVHRGLVVRALGGDVGIPVFLTLSWLEK